jgi:hypothetical protein
LKREVGENNDPQNLDIHRVDAHRAVGGGVHWRGTSGYLDAEGGYADAKMLFRFERGE